MSSQAGMGATAEAAGRDVLRATARRPDKPAEPVRALTAVRGLAAWWVVAFHFQEALPAETPAPVMIVIANGYLAVDLFFVLSGYVIGMNYGNWFRGRGWTHRYIRFLALRLSRIYPLHAFMLAAFLINPLAIALFSHAGNPPDLQWRHYFLSVFLMQNWGFDAAPAWNVPSWSISTEWLAYICCPICMLAVNSVTRRRVDGVALIVFLASVLYLAKFALQTSAPDYNDQIINLLRCIDEFTIGLCVYRLIKGAERTGMLTRLSLLSAALLISSLVIFDAPGLLIAPIGFALLVYGLSDEAGVVARVLRGRVLQWLGLVSYSTYLSHYFIKFWVKVLLIRPSVPVETVFPAYVLGVLAASAVLYNVVEHPGQRWSRRIIAAVLLPQTSMRPSKVLPVVTPPKTPV